MKVLFIGLGSIAQKHKIALESLVPKSVFYALRRKPNMPDEAGITNIYGWENIPKDVSLVLITNPTSEHEQTLIKAIELKKPILLEKPPLHELSNADKLIDLVRKSGVLVYSAFNMRFHPLIEWCKKNVQVNDVLEIDAYCGSYLPNWRPDTDYSKNYSAITKLGGGVHLDLIHEIDYLIYLFGKPISTKRNLRRVSDLKIDSIDSANYWLNFSKFNATVRLNYFRKDPKRTLEIVEKDRTILIDFINFTATNHKGEVLYSAKTDGQQLYNDQMAFFLDSAGNKKILMNDFESSIETLKYCLAND